MNIIFSSPGCLMLGSNDIFHGPRRRTKWSVLALLSLNMSSIDKSYMLVPEHTMRYILFYFIYLVVGMTGRYLSCYTRGCVTRDS